VRCRRRSSLFSQCTGEDCPANPILIADDKTVADVIGVAQGICAVVGVTLTVVLLLLRRWHASSWAQRCGLEPVLLLGAVIMLLGLATATTQQIGSLAKPAQIGFIASFALLPAAFLLGLLRTRFFRAATVGRLIE
jgi:hypothetical protein